MQNNTSRKRAKKKASGSKPSKGKRGSDVSGDVEPFRVLGFTIPQIEKIFIDNFGLVSRVASVMQISRRDVEVMLELPELSHLTREADESNNDFVISRLLRSVADGNVTAMIFWLKCRAKDRGFVERLDVRSFNLTAPLSDLSDEQLRRIADGEPIELVLQKS